MQIKNIINSVLVSLIIITLISVNCNSFGLSIDNDKDLFIEEKVNNFSIEKTLKNKKFEQNLLNFINDYKKSNSNSKINKKELVLNNNKIRMELILSDENKINDLTKLDEKIIIENNYKQIVQVVVPIDKLDKLSNEEYIKFIRNPITPKAFDIESEGKGVIGADLVQSFGYNGEDVKVAVIDLGFKGYMSNPEIPSDRLVEAISFRYDNDIEADERHGCACAELILDIAPKADLYLYNFMTISEFNDAVIHAVTKGVDIISFSIGYVCVNDYDGIGYSEIGDVCGIVDYARDNGILFISSAGNYAMQHYEGNYLDTDEDLLHEFGSEDEILSLGYLPAGSSIHLALSWNDWPYSNQDYDLLLFDGDGYLVANSSNYQTGTQPPYEFIDGTTLYGSNYYVGIYNWSANEDVHFELYSFENEFQTYSHPQSSICCPADAFGAMTAGATYWKNNNLEYFSSIGPTNDGRIKPDICAPDFVSTYSYGTEGFGGTSSASPHVAGAAALLKSAYPYLTAEVLQNVIESSSEDLGSIGKDNYYGAGIINISKAFDSISPNNPPNTPSDSNPVDGAVDQCIDVDLSWVGGDPDLGDVVTYDVYFGSVNPPALVVHNQSGCVFDPGILEYNTDYFWRVVAWDNHSNYSVGVLWNFSTVEEPNSPPFIPNDPIPVDGAVDQCIDVDLSWVGGDPDLGDVVTYDVYFGSVNPPALVVHNQSGCVFDPGILEYNTDYFWRVVAWDNHENYSFSNLWSFNIESEPITSKPIVYIDENYNSSTTGWGYNHFKKIQDGINAVDQNGTVYVFNGTYNERISINKRINLIGEDKNNTIIDGQKDLDVIFVTVNYVNISGFTIQSTREDNPWDRRNSGIYLFSNYNKIIDNKILNNSLGLNLYSSTGNTIKYNIFEKRGIVINSGGGITANSHIIENNTLNNRPIRYYKNSTNLTVPNNTSQLILVNCTNFTIQDLSLTDFGENITLINSHYNTINRNTIQNYNTNAIALNNSTNNVIENNILTNNKNGIFVFNSHNNLISENTISNSSIFNIMLDYSNNNLISKNTVENCFRNIHLWISNNNTFDNNTIKNSSTGLLFYDSVYNVIYHNNFINSTSHHIRNYGIIFYGTVWNESYPSGGNYWDDYSGFDNNSDGIGDESYDVLAEGNIDYYPYMNLNGWLNQAPVAVANGPSTAYIKQDVIFDGSSSYDSDGTITKYTWNFGDGTIAYGLTSTHSYTYIGKFDVTLFVIDDYGVKSDNTSISITISVEEDDTTDDTGDTSTPPAEENSPVVSDEGSVTNAPPTVDAGGPYYGFIGEEIEFDASNSFDSDGTIIAYQWDFDGDGINDTEWLDIPIVYYTYQNKGEYSVSLKVKDNKNSIRSDVAEVFIIKANNPPTIITSYGSINGKINTIYPYTVNSTDPDDNDTVIYTFEWGDGQKENSSVLNSNTTFKTNHYWLTYGVYTINITAVDSQGARDDTKLTVYIDIKLIDDEIKGYLIDNDSDNIYDIFYNITSEENISVLLQNDKYQIDTNNDGIIDYTYDLENGLEAYEEKKEKKIEKTPGFELIIILISLTFFIFIRRKKHR